MNFCHKAASFTELNTTPWSCTGEWRYSSTLRPLYPVEKPWINLLPLPGT